MFLSNARLHYIWCGLVSEESEFTSPTYLNGSSRAFGFFFRREKKKSTYYWKAKTSKTYRIPKPLLRGRAFQVLFSHVFKRAYIYFILFSIVLYFCTSTSYITMTCKNREYMLRYFTCKNYPPAWPFKQPSTALFLALSAESEYFIAYPVQRFDYFRSCCESSKVFFSVAVY